MFILAHPSCALVGGFFLLHWRENELAYLYLQFETLVLLFYIVPHVASSISNTGPSPIDPHINLSAMIADHLQPDSRIVDTSEAPQNKRGPNDVEVVDSKQSELRVFERMMGNTELSYYLQSRSDGVNDM